MMTEDQAMLPEISLSGQRMGIPTEAGWQHLDEPREIGGFTVDTLSSKPSNFGTGTLPPGFRHALGLIWSFGRHCWRPYTLMQTSDSYVRVFLPLLECEECHVQNAAACVTSVDLYYGYDGGDDAWKTANQVDAAVCPECRALYSRQHIVWWERWDPSLEENLGSRPKTVSRPKAV
jgi:hypothetical protein